MAAKDACGEIEVTYNRIGREEHADYPWRKGESHILGRECLIRIEGILNNSGIK